MVYHHSKLCTGILLLNWVSILLQTASLGSGNGIGIVKENLLKAQERMKFYTDAHHLERVLEVGDRVYLKLQPYRQASKAICRCLKLSSRYYGSVAYRLEWPEGARIHNVIDLKTSKQIWDKLEKMYMSKSLSYKLFLKQRLYG
ncbi:hypothetical protein V2J09_016106 [Rumex salicifolius]